MSTNDKFDGRPDELDSPAGGAFAVTPHNTNLLPVATRGIYVGGSGDVAGYTVAGHHVTFVGVPAGFILPVRMASITVAGTTATSIVGLY